MSCPPSQTLNFDRPAADADSSDYGSDFTPEEEELLHELLDQVATTTVATTPAVPSTVASPPIPPRSPSQQTFTSTTAVLGDIEDYNGDAASGRVPRVLGRQMPPWQVAKSRNPNHRFPTLWSGAGGRANPNPGYGARASVEHPDSTEGRTRDREREAARQQEQAGRNGDPAVGPGSLSPLERFRRPPNKAFSVTDLISPAWCELQYWYTLTKFGRKRRTPAMKTGSTIHKTLEDEIYTTVSVEITTREDALALRIWNVIQGLRMLREYGITRELEVWGVVDGELVNGVIDELSFECPDPELELTAASHYADIEASRAVMPEYQMSLTEYLLSPSQGGRRLSDMSWQEEPAQGSDDSFSMGSRSTVEIPDLPRVYMTDVKTRGGNGSLPTVKSTAFRPTSLQLQMYYHMLNRLVTSDDVTIDLLAARYGLDPTRTFTDAFIMEVGGLNDQFFDALSSQDLDPDFVPTPEDVMARRTPPSSQSQYTTDSSDAPSASQDSTSMLLTHSNLSSLWNLMKEQLRLTFLPPLPPHSSSVSVAPSIPSEFQPPMLESYPTVLSPLLTARYISSTPAEDSSRRELGSRSFLFDPTSLTSYLSDQMEWWRGERNPRGVEVMEAWKCRICEFNDECSWRQERELAFARRKRGRRGSTAAAAV
ncbi:hypothetical protein P170DRAFT_462268 [Aspergillus steynii IBT 23096]|uniref:Uncharacterized protein n=1 Tax=Aspergillus steynii IBT 23096 TaxID=1392250 RepID=A0A2I2GHC0_9EURO|nr:uncharacterized protein P170DRAFT_462268 [Aspergillus steynii IBT 23096]PLB52279.1 hypothetical protein P170DRAFT_462268 [Aspergillus steynii IBT 23096]